MPRMTLQTGK